MESGQLTLFLCGDVMTGRGVDQILPHPGPASLIESDIRDARTYMRMAEAVNGAIHPPVAPEWPWGVALGALHRAEVRVINVETSITGAAEFDPGKAVHYRMSPGNVPCLRAARPDVCVLANNHVLDFGQAGLDDTLGVLRSARLPYAGAGRAADEARSPAVVPLRDGRRILVVAAGFDSSGIPSRWAANHARPGVHYLPDLADATADVITDAVSWRRNGDLLVVSLHWGPNWGYQVSDTEIGFAHRLIDRGADIVHGHSAHHPRPIEVYRGRLILYGCGDFIDDYEGIPGYERYRDDLRLAYFPVLERESGALRQLRMWPMQSRRLRLHATEHSDSLWLRDVLTEVSRPFQTRVVLDTDGSLTLRWPEIR